MNVKTTGPTDIAPASVGEAMDPSALDAVLRAEQNEEYERGLEEVTRDAKPRAANHTKCPLPPFALN